ncbi:MAG TPA: FecR domain-containing protein [Usitatibacter sp.]|nr:FecR domain-containing protein [Usitatibacter sp.]
MTAHVITRRERYEQAARWLLEVQAEGAPPEAFAGMLAWCDADPLNRLAMERIEEAWAVTGEVPKEELGPRLRRDDRRWLGGIAAALVISIAVGLAMPRGEISAPTRIEASTGERVATALGEHEKATLPDGSLVELGGRSSMSIVYSPQQRVIVAEDGEAFFSVSSNPSRPFIVRAGPVTVTAVGTAFSVRRAGESVSVVVTEGVVEVAAEKGAIRAEAGERVRFDRGELLPARDPVPIEIATSWREGRLQFVDEPLRLVIASVNRYSEREVLLADSAIEELRFTGTVFEKGVEDWLRGVASVFPVRIVPIDKRRVMIAPISENAAPRV